MRILADCWLGALRIGVLGRGPRLRDETIVVIVAIGEGRVGLLRLKVPVMAQDLLRRPAVVIVLAGQIDHLAAGSLDSHRAVIVGRAPFWRPGQTGLSTCPA